MANEMGERKARDTKRALTGRSAGSRKRAWGFLLPIALLAPLSLGAKGCDAAVVGDDCAAGSQSPHCSNTGGSASTGGKAGATGGVASTGGFAATGGSTATGGSSGGVSCGGFNPSPCQKHEFCNFPAGTQCGAADQPGVCQAIPDACDLVFAPVCGCDGKTYSNSCFAAMAGVSVATDGKCPGEEPKACGGLLGLQCADGEYCSFAPDAHCGAADQTGVCTPLAEICTTDVVPVCGCDGKTYSNSCEAARKGVSVAADGACEPTGTLCGGDHATACASGEYCAFSPEDQCGAAKATGVCTQIPSACTKELDPVCGCNGVTYSNPCLAAAAGVSVNYTGRCTTSPPGKACGGIAGLACDKDQYCAYPLEAKCGAFDQTGTCATKPEACITLYDPVCGCDGKTYGNACSAANAGMAVAAKGECP